MTICNQVAIMLHGNHWSETFQNPKGLKVHTIKKMTSEFGASPVALMIHLDQSDYPGLLKEIATQLIEQHVSKLLPRELQEAEAFRAMMVEGREYFGVCDDKSFKEAAISLTNVHVNESSSMQEKLALIAHIKHCLREYDQAITISADALSEEAEPGFISRSFLVSRNQKKTLRSVETRLIETFLKTIEGLQAQRT